MKMNMKKILKISSTVIAVIIGLAIIGLLFIQISPNYSLFFVKSGSMSPAIKPGDLVITGPVDGWFTGKLEVGKVITFKQTDLLVTHRIVGIEGDQYITKGDANEDRDANLVPVQNIIGIKMFSIPKLGFINSFVSTRRGWFLVIVIPTIVLVIFIIKDIVKESFKGSKKEKKEFQGGENIEAKKEDEKGQQ
ncbi:MAG: signal peptidase I [Dehalococcoidales bacterium]|nr:signal peptidase I [Dehalococcoidales bacterium]